MTKTKSPPKQLPVNACYGDLQTLLDMDVETLRREYGVRFHHFLLKKNGQIAATLVTVPTNDPVDHSVVVVVAPKRGPEGDTATRKGGRNEALARLIDGHIHAKALKLPRELTIDEFIAGGVTSFPKLGEATVVPTELLKAAIVDRTVLQLLLGPSARSPKSLRPRQPCRTFKAALPTGFLYVDPFDMPEPEPMIFESDEHLQDVIPLPADLYDNTDKKD